eukprot:1660115-Pleurochrysis_carterae.AAC.1
MGCQYVAISQNSAISVRNCHARDVALSDAGAAYSRVDVQIGRSLNEYDAACAVQIQYKVYHTLNERSRQDASDEL